MPPLSPPDEYRARLARHEAAAAALDTRDAGLAYLRLAVFAIGAGLAVAAWRDVLAWGWVAAPALAFAALAWRHARVLSARDDARRAARFYERGLARMEDRWAGAGGATGERFRDDEHLYASDLDLFGPASLFELLSTARTRAGETALAGWLTSPAGPEEIRARQAAVEELAPRLDLREALTRAGAATWEAVDDPDIDDWALEDAQLPGISARRAALAFNVAALAAAAWWALSAAWAPLLLVLGLQAGFAAVLRRRVERVLHRASAPARELAALAVVLDHVSREPFETAWLVGLRHRLETRGESGVAAIRRLARLTELHDWQHNQIFGPVGALLLWGTHLALAVEGWRARHARDVSAWVAAVGEFEALDSLATYRFEHPADVWPVVVDGPGQAVFDGIALGHPLLPAATLVRNDVTLGDAPGLLLVSGSNMSGKSTLLRTVGVNAVLALAGAPVRAASLRLSPVTVGATLRVQDSLREGRSRFYAEVVRLGRVHTAAAGPRPVLFLFDELFQGTNSHDRLAGAQGLLRHLVERGAIGLVTTHDLALTGVTAALGARAANVHFEDRFEDGQMVFDYRMRPGPVGRGNGLALMRAVGLDVEADGPG